MGWSLLPASSNVRKFCLQFNSCMIQGGFYEERCQIFYSSTRYQDLCLELANPNCFHCSENPARKTFLDTRHTTKSSRFLEVGFKQLKMREGRIPGTSPRTEAECAFLFDSLILVFKDHCHSSPSKKRDHSVYFLCLRGFSDCPLMFLPWCINAYHRGLIMFGIFSLF